MISCLHCNMPFNADPEGVAIVGLSEQDKLQDLLVRLRGHMELQHPEQFGLAALMADRTLAFGVLVNFAIPDGPIALWRTQTAATVHQLVGRPLSDEQITEAVNRFPLVLLEPAESQRRVSAQAVALVKQLRDWLAYGDVLRVPAERAQA